MLKTDYGFTDELVNEFKSLNDDYTAPCAFRELSSDQIAVRGAATPVADSDPMALLRTLGIQPLTPSVAPFCTTPTDDNPLGLVTAGASIGEAFVWMYRAERACRMQLAIQQSGAEVTPIGEIDDLKFSVGEITQWMMEDYDKVVGKADTDAQSAAE